MLVLEPISSIYLSSLSLPLSLSLIIWRPAALSCVWCVRSHTPKSHPCYFCWIAQLHTPSTSRATTTVLATPMWVSTIDSVSETLDYLLIFAFCYTLLSSHLSEICQTSRDAAAGGAFNVVVCKTIDQNKKRKNERMQILFTHPPQIVHTFHLVERWNFI